MAAIKLVSSLKELVSDVTIATPLSGNLLRYNGTKWVNTTLASGDIPTTSLNHNSMLNLATGDVHTQYLNLNGRAGTQAIVGAIDFQPSGVSNLYLDTNGVNIGGGISPKSILQVAGAVQTASTTVTGSITIDATYSSVLCDATVGSFTITLPAATLIAGRQYKFKLINTNSNTVTLAVSGGGNIEGSSSFLLNFTNQAITLESTGTLGYSLITRTRSLVSVKTITASSYTVLVSDDFIVCNPNTANCTITLPDPTLNLNKVIEVKRKSATYTVTVITAASTIDGGSSVILDVRYKALRFVSDGVEWGVY